MTDAQKLFCELGENIEGSSAAKLFGKPCYKINNKAYCCFFQNEMVFTGDTLQKAKSLEGSQLFDPSGKNRAMKEWVQVPFEDSEFWGYFVKEAAKYVSGK